MNDNGLALAIPHAASEAARDDSGDKAGLLTLLILSLGAALVPWLGQTDFRLSLAYSLVALALPGAAFRARSWPDEETVVRREPAPPRTAPPARPAPPRHREVAIIGGGFSGTMLTVHLARAGAARITLIERASAPGRGLAYATANPGHLLNVRADRMSAYPEDPGHFVRWLAARGPGEAGDFAPSPSYGLYLEQQLRQAHADVFPRLTLVTGDAFRMETSEGRQRVILGDGRAIEADDVILATGNPPPPRLAAFAGLPHHLYAAEPWRPGLAGGLGRDDTVLLVGTGLTMADAVISLTDAGFDGRILAVSRRGLLPRVHAAGHAAPTAPEPTRHLPLSRALAAFRARAADIGWRTAMEELRPATQGLWKALTEPEKARFLRHLRPWWDVHRHRLAPEIGARLEALRAAGRFESMAGNVLHAGQRYGKVAVSLCPRGGEEVVRLEVARAINCAGAEVDVRRTDNPLLRSLLAAGAVRPDAQQLGLDTGRNGEAIGADGFATPGLFALGPLARGRLWETTAVPELRAQAAAMAALLAADAPAHASIKPLAPDPCGSPHWPSMAPRKRGRERS